MDIKWLTDLTVDELQKRANELQKPYKKVDINGIVICDNLSIEEMGGEIFKKYPNSSFKDISTGENIEVGNFGRIKFSGEILPQYIPEDDENLYVDIPSIRTKKREKIYRLVAKTWCENPDIEFYNQVHHISNNWYDNRMENLLWVTETQHAKIHPFMMNTIHGITIQFGPGINVLIENSNSILFNEIKELKNEIECTRIKCIGCYGTYYGFF